MNNEILPEVRPRRVGTISLGISLVGFVIVFLLRIFWSAFPVVEAIRFWPVLLIILGTEILLAGIGKKEFVIDKASVILLFISIVFVNCLAIAQYAIDMNLWSAI